MKKTKFLASMLAIAMALLLFPANTMEVAADEPTTYTVKYIPECEDWRFLPNTNYWQDDGYHREVYYLREQLKDGDVVVVYNFNPNWVPVLDLGSAKLSNLTICDADSPTIIYAGGIDVFFAHNGVCAAINCDVNTAFVYDDSTCNFNGNVGTLNFYADGEINSIMGVGGTLGHFCGTNFDGTQVIYDYYNFKENTFAFYDHGFQTPPGNYSLTPVAVQPPVSSGSTTSGSTSSGDYDDVPKTGDNFLAMWLLLGAAFCFSGSLYLKKKA